MKHLMPLFVLAVLLAGCATSNKDFVQGWIRITPPVKFDPTPMVPAADGGTIGSSFVDAQGRKFDYYIDHRLGTKTPGAIYLRNYPGHWGSVRVVNQDDFNRAVGWGQPSGSH